MLVYSLWCQFYEVSNIFASLNVLGTICYDVIKGEKPTISAYWADNINV